MNFLPEKIETYCDDHTQSEPELLKSLVRETWQKVINPRMLSGHVQGRFLSLMSKMIRPKRILEIGTYTGYSAICLSEGLVDGGELITLDINDELAPIHQKYFGQWERGNMIRPVYGDAREFLAEANLDFDLVFMDADKSSYPFYYEILMRHLKSGAIILVDNVLWSGKIVEEAHPQDLDTKALQTLNDLIQQDDRVENVLLPLRDGVMMLRVK